MRLRGDVAFTLPPGLAGSSYGYEALAWVVAIDWGSRPLSGSRRQRRPDDPRRLALPVVFLADYQRLHG